MKVKNLKSLALYSLMVLLGVLACFILGCLWAGGALLLSDNGEKLPIRSLGIVIDVEQRDELFTQLKSFAEKHDFEILIRDVKVQPNGIYIVISRNDIEIRAIDTPMSPENITFRFYDRPPFPLSQETVDELFNELRSFLEEIPNVTIKEEK